MAVYTCITQEGTLSAEQRADLAKEITRSHVAMSGEPASFVRVIFETVSPDCTFSGGKPAVNASIVGIIRGRSTEVKAQLLNDLWSLYKNVTGLSDDQLWVSVTEIPPSNAMEFGAIIPEVGHEAEWQASLGLTKEEA
jgi:phenylpyruvate tautomerase PptA (4-oxalocrotonate tautomerase family)